MELKPGMSALITGGASGIGKALALALGKIGIFVTVVDISEEKGKNVVFFIEKENTRFHPLLKCPTALFIKCDVTDEREISAAFDKHVETFGGLDICINSAGVAHPIPIDKDDQAFWKQKLSINLVAVIDSTRLAIKAMLSGGKPGTILNIGSAAGLYPMYDDSVYSASKGGVVLFTRSLVPYKHHGIRVNVLCPEFVQTEMARNVSPKLINLLGGFLPMEMIVKGAFELIKDESKAGSCLLLSNIKGFEYWPPKLERRKKLLNSLISKQSSTFSEKYKVKISSTFEKIVVHKLSHRFREATKIVTSQLKIPINSKHVLVKVLYAGVNASDVNFSSGHYFSGKKEESMDFPFDAGFEAVGLIAAIGDSVNSLTVGTPVAVMAFGSYAEFITVPSKHVFPVSHPHPEVIAMLTSGLTASIALEKVAQMESGKVVLVTAAAGGTGQFAVQLAKLAGNMVVATCGGEKKAALLKELGVDRIIDYKKEDITTVLKEEFPNGVDIIYESVGGKMFDISLKALAIYGRLIVIGMISQYQGKHGWKALQYPGLCEKILAKSQTVAGFFLLHYSHLWKEHIDRLFGLFSDGKLKISIDPKKFVGLHSVADAVEYLHSGDNLGKVVVCIDPTFNLPMAKL